MQFAAAVKSEGFVSDDKVDVVDIAEVVVFGGAVLLVSISLDAFIVEIAPDDVTIVVVFK